MRAQLIALGVAVFVGHGGEPLQSVRPDRASAQPAAASGTATGDAATFLAAARGTAPAICALAVTPLGNDWGVHGAPLDPRAAETPIVAWALKPTLDDRDLSVLEEGLRDEDACVRAMSSRLLGDAGSNGVRALLDALDDDDARTRRAGVEGLGYSDDATVAPALIRRLRDDVAAVRAAAAWALGRVEAADAVDELGAALRDPEPIVRLAAVEALGELETEGTLDLLLPMLGSDDARIRAATVHAIGELY